MREKRREMETENPKWTWEVPVGEVEVNYAVFYESRIDSVDDAGGNDREDPMEKKLPVLLIVCAWSSFASSLKT